MSPKPLVVLLTALLLGVPAAGRAEPDGGDKEAAARAFAKGTALVEQRNYVAAIEAFKLAYRLRPHFFVHCSVARCYQNLTDVVKAAEYYQRCLDEGGAKDKVGQRIRISLKAVSTQITWMKIKSPGRGGTIFVNGRQIGPAPRKIPLNPGTHVIEVRREGAKPAQSTIKTLGGEERVLTLAPLELGSPADPGRRPGPGPQEPPPSSSRGLSSIWFWSAAGLTVALAAVTAVLGAQTLGLQSDFEEQPTEEGADAFESRRLLTNVFFGLTAAAAGGTTLLFFFTDFRGRPQDQAKEALVVGGGLQGTF